MAELYRRAGLRRPVDDLPRIGRMLSNANLVIAAFDGKRLVGIARAWHDGAWCCYLADLAVDPVYQRKGIGRELVRRVREQCGEEVMILLLSAAGAEGFYPRVGFEKADNAWKVPRKK